MSTVDEPFLQSMQKRALLEAVPQSVCTMKPCNKEDMHSYFLYRERAEGHVA